MTRERGSIGKGEESIDAADCVFVSRPGAGRVCPGNCLRLRRRSPGVVSPGPFADRRVCGRDLRLGLLADRRPGPVAVRTEGDPAVMPGGRLFLSVDRAT